jgi:pimeloyl-ACP methyl ester carboxylesterase
VSQVRRGRLGVLSRASVAIAALVAMADSPPRWPEADQSPQSQTWLLELRSRAFVDAEGPAVAVHVPPGFDAGGGPGVILYFHGWNGCVRVALGDDDEPCVEGGPDRKASSLAAQLDQAGVNAMLVAIELRPDVESGDPGKLAEPGRVRAMMQELFVEHLALPFGRTLDVDALGPTIVVAHSGGYQAAAATLARGGVRVDDVVLLDALYGADDVFGSAVRAGVQLLDLYTCCGGTDGHSRALAAALVPTHRDGDVMVDDGDSDLDPTTLTHTVFFKRVPAAHALLPQLYARVIFEQRLTDVRNVARE